MRGKPLLYDEQWTKIEPLLPNISSKGRPWRNNREVLEGILWLLKKGARWRATSPKNIPVPIHAVEGSGSGKKTMFG